MIMNRAEKSGDFSRLFIILFFNKLAIILSQKSWNGAKNACKKSWNGVILQHMKILEWCNYEKKDVSNPAEMEAGRTRQKGIDD